jgi:hypothetical protein
MNWGKWQSGLVPRRRRRVRDRSLDQAAGLPPFHFFSLTLPSLSVASFTSCVVARPFLTALIMVILIAFAQMFTTIFQQSDYCNGDPNKDRDRAELVRLVRCNTLASPSLLRVLGSPFSPSTRCCVGRRRRKGLSRVERVYGPLCHVLVLVRHPLGQRADCDRHGQLQEGLSRINARPFCVLDEPVGFRRRNGRVIANGPWKRRAVPATRRTAASKRPLARTRGVGPWNCSTTILTTVSFPWIFWAYTLLRLFVASRTACCSATSCWGGCSRRRCASRS